MRAAALYPAFDLYRLKRLRAVRCKPSELKKSIADTVQR